MTPDPVDPPRGNRESPLSGVVGVYVHSPHNVLCQALEQLVASMGYQVVQKDQAELALVDLTSYSGLYPLPPVMPSLALINGDEEIGVAVLRLGYQGYVWQDSKP